MKVQLLIRNKINTNMRYYEILNEQVDTNSEQFKNWFNGSKVVDSNGKPLVMYHGWQSLDMDDHGINTYFPLTHFGTIKAANNRIKDKYSNYYNYAVYPVYLSIKNPLRIVDNKNTGHAVSDIATYLAFGSFDYRPHRLYVDDNDVDDSDFVRNKKYGKISIEEYNEIIRGDYRGDVFTFVNILKKNGYDGMVYKNRVEHRGSESWVIFDNSQIWPLYKSIPESKLELPDIETGDTVMVGKFKNRKATIKGFDTDKNNQPILKTDKGNQKLFKPRIVKLMKESTVKLTDMYDSDELTNKSEILYNFVDDNDLDRNFIIHTMSPQEAMTFTIGRDNTLIMDAYKQFASINQKRLVKEKMKNYDHNRIVVVMNKTIVDGNHQIVAGILAKQPIKYIDLTDYSMENINESINSLVAGSAEELPRKGQIDLPSGGKIDVSRIRLAVGKKTSATAIRAVLRSKAGLSPDDVEHVASRIEAAPEVRQKQNAAKEEPKLQFFDPEQIKANRQAEIENYQMQERYRKKAAERAKIASEKILASPGAQLWSKKDREEVELKARIGDAQGAIYEAKFATLAAVEKIATKVAGLKLCHVSASRGRPDSRYFVHTDANGEKTEIRVSNHEIPETQERFDRNLAQGMRWHEIIVGPEQIEWSAEQWISVLSDIVNGR